MIKYELRCAEGHGFEAWFRNGDAFESQAAAAEISCPHCGDRQVAKAPMAPSIAKSRGREAVPVVSAGAPQATGAGVPADPADAARRKEAMEILAELRRKVEENCDYVGDRFAEEARRIHYGETDARGIYGETSETEARELAEEGVSFSRIPWVPRSDA
ncbi:DUF1178 family protein [Arenibaculum pallidiluteum]|uniref:DUF1178 family protein n=1 Tax=Arenibaculum pallidiluteum TaxID=2812559 RepID=UPI001A95988E|nr:DUF1178 family protein [Arenibaculum pallidiluteum]